MPETDPIVTRFQADTDDLETGLNQGKRALREYGDEAEHTERKSFRLVRQSTSLLGSILAIRGAFSLTAQVLEDLGVKNENLTRFMRAMELETNIVVAALQIYRAVSAAVTAQDLARAKATFLAGIANVSASTLFIGTAAAIAAAIAAWVIISTLSAPRAQFGGVVNPRPGGTSVIVGEAGEPEAIIPLRRAREFGFGGGSPIHVTMNIQTNDPDRIVRELGRRIQQLQGAGA